MDVLHIRGLSSDGYSGYDVISLMKDALGVGMAAQRFGARFFGQGSNMSGILMVPGHFDEQKIKNTIQAWNTMQTGLTNSHKIALLQDGVKFQQMTISPDQAQFLQTRQYEVRATVANITGCPPHKLGDDTRTSHSSLEAENQSYLDECLDTWLCEFETGVQSEAAEPAAEDERHALCRVQPQGSAANVSEGQSGVLREAPAARGHDGQRRPAG